MKRAPVVALLFLLATVAALAQEGPQSLREPRVPRAPRRVPEIRTPPASDANAPETQQRLQQLLQQYPPSLARVIALDPTLLTNQSYLETYPALAQFLDQHPEVAHNPGYFLGQFRDGGPQRYDYNDPKVVAIREVGEM